MYAVLRDRHGSLNSPTLQGHNESCLKQIQKKKTNKQNGINNINVCFPNRDKMDRTIKTSIVRR